MKAVLSLLRDRRRSQRGSILGGVLMITAFIAIIAGAMLTELSTNLLLSRNLVDRVANEATDNSALELSLSQLQAAQLNAACPGLATASVNNLQASSSYLSCWATVRESQKVVPVGGSGSQFSLDGTHALLNGVDDYVVADAGGAVFDIPFGWSSPRWSLQPGSSVTATPLVLPVPGRFGQVLDAIPIEGSACSPSEFCLDVRLDTAGAQTSPPLQCVASTLAGQITAQPGLSSNTGGLVYFGSGSTLVATDVSNQGGGVCDFESSAPIPNNEQLQAQPFAYPCARGCGQTSEYVYAVVGNSGSSHLLQFAYGRSTLSQVQSLTLPWGNVQGAAVSGANLPATIAITFGGGQVALVQINSSGNMSLGASASTGSGILDAPYWYHRAGGDLIGVGAQNGGLYLYDAALQPYAQYGGGSAITTTPSTDAAGNWYFGANDGFVHEVQATAGQPAMKQVDTFGPMGRTTSSVVVGGCSTGICVYLGSADHHAYLVPLDARRAIISTCITTAPPGCSGDNPRLWASVEIGAAGNPQAVHVEGWSYYSG